MRCDQELRPLESIQVKKEFLGILAMSQKWWTIRLGWILLSCMIPAAFSIVAAAGGHGGGFVYQALLVREHAGFALPIQILFVSSIVVMLVGSNLKDFQAHIVVFLVGVAMILGAWFIFFGLSEMPWLTLLTSIPFFLFLTIGIVSVVICWIMQIRKRKKAFEIW